MLVPLIGCIPPQCTPEPDKEQRPCDTADNDTGDRTAGHAVWLRARGCRICSRVSHLEVGDGDILPVISLMNGKTLWGSRYPEPPLGTSARRFGVDIPF
jgi:hypothetical protein